MGTVSDTLDVSGPETFLDIHKLLSKRMRQPQKVWNKRMHTSWSEKNSWVILWNKRRIRNQTVLVFTKKIQEQFP
jgi:hypothetical protein